jgi:hypothetical protein
MKTQHLAVTAMALLLTSHPVRGHAFAGPSRAEFGATLTTKSQPARTTRTVTLDLTGLD